MKLLDSITWRRGEEEVSIQLLCGDLTAMVPEDRVDVLVVSAFPGDYRPTERSLIGGLHRLGISVQQLAGDKSADLREHFHCWMSKPISKTPGAEFERILCFEPESTGSPAEFVSGIFQALMPFAQLGQVNSIAVPLVATGDQQASILEMFEALFDSAHHWLSFGLPIRTMKIVVRDPLKAAELKGALAILKRSTPAPSNPASKSGHAYDVFLSYSHEDTADAEYIVECLRARDPGVRIFMDRLELNPGAAWQQTIFDALDDSRLILSVISPAYLKSKMCKEEFNIALQRQRNEDNRLLRPIYLAEVDMPTYMQMVQYVNCTERDRDRIRNACESIVQ